MNAFAVIVVGYDGSSETAGFFDSVEKAETAKRILEKDSSRSRWDYSEIEETALNRLFYEDLDINII